MVLRGEEIKYAYELDKIVLPYKCTRTVMTMNFGLQGLKNTDNIIIPNIPNGIHWMQYRSIYKKYYEENFNVIDYIKKL